MTARPREFRELIHAPKGGGPDLARELARGAAAACDLGLKTFDAGLVALTSEVEAISAEAAAFLARELATLPCSEIT